MLEKAWYELSPLAYSSLSVIILFSANFLARLFALILLLASLLIVVMRMQYRSTPKALLKRRSTYFKAATVTRRA